MNPVHRLRKLLPYDLGRAHSLPVFDGQRSRGHADVALWRLQLKGALEAVRRRDRLAQVESVVQFAGFPRSGHSLIGSLIDAHPEASVAHELDAMGLLMHHLPMRSVVALMDEAAQRFTRHGRYWNGYSYLVANAAHASTRPPRVVGDKKGDMAVRRIAREPALLERLNRGHAWRKPWICVLRNPFDNIATMSLRATRVYDHLRTTHDRREAFETAVRKAQADGEIPASPLAAQIDEYERLCAAVSRIQRATPIADWFELSHEEFSQAPTRQLGELLAFLGLEASSDYLAECSSLVHASTHRSRTMLDWPAADVARVQGLIAQHDFLRRYAESGPQ